MNTTTIKYIGVDVAKSRLDVDLPAPGHQVPSTAEAIEEMLRGLPPGAHLVCESTGGYESILIAAAQAAGVPISVVPPQRVRNHARSTGAGWRRPTGWMRSYSVITDKSMFRRPCGHRNRTARSSRNSCERERSCWS
jgi:transposase